MLIGPFLKEQESEIEKILNKKGIFFKVIVDHDKINKSAIDILKDLPADHPLRKSQDQQILLDINTADVVRLGKSLERFGFFGQNLDQSVFSEEYICPKCNYTLEVKGICPHHKLKLMSSSQWISHRKSYNIWKERILNLIFLALVLVGGYFGFMKLIQDIIKEIK